MNSTLKRVSVACLLMFGLLMANVTYIGTVKADGLRSGKFPVDVQMVDQAGHPFQRPAQVVVRSTRYGRLALGVTFAAAAVLVLAAGFRLVRRALRTSEPAA